MTQQYAVERPLMRQQMEEVEPIALPERKDDDFSTRSTVCGWKKRTLIWLGISLLTIIGGLVCGLVLLIDPLLNELISLGAVSDETLFSDPKSPQSRALEILKLMKRESRDRSALDLLQRYALTVLFYSIDGDNWVLSQAYILSSLDVCYWNNGKGGYGVYCRADGESVDELRLSYWDRVVSYNIQNGQLPWELVLLTNLKIMDLGTDGLGIGGSIPSELGALTSLEFLRVDHNRMTGTIPSELGQLLSLTSLDIGVNNLNGTIPTELGQLLSLTYLDISNNQLTGTIPTELGQLVSLTYLSVRSNQLTGTIPTELGQLLSLTSLDLIGDAFTGTIPTELGQMISLTSLDIEGYYWTGTIPTELGQLLSLTSLAISSNELTGTIPTEFGQLLSLILCNIRQSVDRHNPKRARTTSVFAKVRCHLESVDRNNPK
jgi:hypothetical protein